MYINHSTLAIQPIGIMAFLQTVTELFKQQKPPFGAERSISLRRYALYGKEQLQFVIHYKSEDGARSAWRAWYLAEATIMTGGRMKFTSGDFITKAEKADWHLVLAGKGDIGIFHADHFTDYLTMTSMTEAAFSATMKSFRERGFNIDN